jgi:NAD(P)-dependent dehydrogenase (short-subunit alcohol dehydrogenase family)
MRRLGTLIEVTARPRLTPCAGFHDTHRADVISFFHYSILNRTHYCFPTTNVSGEPAQVASVACFLLSDAASYVTGNNVEVSGGLA